MLLEVNHIYKSYPDLPVLHDASLTADAGEIVCLLGPSGCGKSTLLRIIAGLESSDSGRVLFDGQDLADAPVHQRNFGLMFQDYALFPHRNVAENVGFGLRMLKRSRAEIDRRVAEMLALVGLGGYEARRVTELSGGEQQRVALARSLAPGPRLLMLDEPLGALDRALREQLMNDLRAILKRVGVTTLYVTHDQAEAFAIADTVQIMQARLDVGEGGRVVQAGQPEAVYRRPATAYVARFLGFRNLLEGTVASAPGRDDTHYVVDTPLGRLHAADVAGDYPPGARVAVLIRPEAADVLPAEAAGSAPNVIPGRLASSSFRGSYFLVQMEHADGVTLTCEVPVTDAHLPAPGEPLALHLNPQAITLLEP